MKKRLLITSIVMMLVVAVALSTATYAWFTSNTSVKADAVVLTASTMSGAAVLITHNADGSEASQEISLRTAGESKLYPATPKTATALTTFADTGTQGNEGYIANDIANIGENFQNLLMTGTGKYSDPGISSPDVSFYKDTFYVFNKGYAAVTLTPTITIYYDVTDNTAAMAAQSARIAIIERVATAEADLGAEVPFASNGYSVKGIWQYDASNSVYTAVGSAAFDEDQTYYTRTGEGTTQSPYVYTVVTLTENENDHGEADFETKKATLYIKTASIAAKNAANTDAYGAVVNASTGFDQGSVNISPNNFTAIAAAHSSKHIANEYTVVVWLEGWDADCTNAITAGSFRVGVSFDAA